MPPSGQTICLCMIVKNEAPVVRRCLDSVRPLIDHWIIVDTGSTDGTQDIVREHFRDIPGELVERPWRDFAHNRSEALTLARPHGDYSLIVDADDAFDVPAGFRMPDLDADAYMVDIRDNAVSYQRTQLVRNTLPWRYVGVLHEFVACDGSKTTGHLPVVMVRNHDGARRRDPDTYRKDAAILERALETETDPFLRSRYTFYLAQSYRDCGEREKAVKHYLARADLGFWDQEVFVSLLQAGRLMEGLGRPPDAVIDVFHRATRACPSRAEAAYEIARLGRMLGRNQDGYVAAAAARGRPALPHGLFIEPWIYRYGLLDEFAVNAYWIGRYAESRDACLELLMRDDLPAGYRQRIAANARFALERAAETSVFGIEGIPLWPNGSVPVLAAPPPAADPVSPAPDPVFVSIITPTRDRPDDLARALLYVLDQTHPAIEWLILDDSAQPFADADTLLAANVSYEHVSQQMRIGEKRNRLIERSRGDIIIQFDDDDYYAPEYVATMVAELSCRKADLINLRGWFLYDRRSEFFGYWDISRKTGPHFRCDGNGVGITVLDETNNGAFSNNHLGFGFGYAFRRAVWEHVRFPEIDWNEDGQFALEAAKHFKVDGFVDTRGLCLHILHARSTSRCFPQHHLPRFLKDRLFPRLAEGGGAAHRPARLALPPRRPEARGLRIVASMTTIPSRIDAVRPVIEAALAQTIPIDHIELNIPEVCIRTGEPYVLPEWLDGMDRVAIFRTEDFGPITKVAPTLLRYRDDPDTHIWSIDDDCAYPPNQLALLMKAHSPDRYRILTRYGGHLNTDGTVQFLYGEVDVTMFEGFGGVLYPPGCIGGDFAAYLDVTSANVHCRKNDDLVLAMYFNLHGIKMRLYNKPTEHTPYMVTGWLPHSRQDALQDTGHAQNYRQIYAFVNGLDWPARREAVVPGRGSAAEASVSRSQI